LVKGTEASEQQWQTASKHWVLNERATKMSSSSTAQGLQLDWHQRQNPLLHKEKEGTVESGLSAIFDIMACNDVAELTPARIGQRNEIKKDNTTLREYKLK
jgi:hypothetical protein